MADYIEFEARASDESSDGEILADVNNGAMIDDSEQQNNDASFFRFCNQARDPAKVLEEIAAEQAHELDDLEASNYMQGGNR